VTRADSVFSEVDVASDDPASARDVTQALVGTLQYLRDLRHSLQASKAAMNATHGASWPSGRDAASDRATTHRQYPHGRGAL
jgi:hypothetical protein